MALAGKTTPAAAPAKVAAKAPAKKAAANATEFEVKFETPGILKLVGVIDSIQGNILMLSHKKHASSKYAIKPIATENIRLIRGTVAKGETVEVIFFDQKATFLRLRRAMLEGYDEKMGMMKGTDETGRPFMAPGSVVNATTMSEVVAPPVSIAKK